MAVKRDTNLIYKTDEDTVRIDAAGETLGRLAAQIAILLRGKDLPAFAPNKFPDRKVVVFNTDKIKVTGGKEEKKIYYHYTGYPGGIKQRQLKELFDNDSTQVLRRAVYGMLPKNKLRQRMIGNLKLFSSNPENNNE